jgi:7,8-dihydropterin-6-yl-methyl-4-(beta-D-ribofuranosyl)aminobenzene 5'-phosphate synthase
MRVTVLVENTVGRTLPISGEHGLSLWVEYEGHKLLFDTGQRGAVVTNAALLGIDLRQAEAIVLSHGHYDHTGGLRRVCEYLGRSVPVYAHPEVFSAHRVSSPADKYVGFPLVREEIEDLGAVLNWVAEPLELYPGLWLSGEVPRRTAFEKGDPRMYVYRNGERVPDPLKDDSSIYIAAADGLVVLLGCAHAGLVNIIEHARTVTAVNKVTAVLGGTHLGPVDAVQLDASISFLEALDLSLLAANHCTGQRVAARLAAVFGERFRFAAAGEVLEI